MNIEQSLFLFLNSLSGNYFFLDFLFFFFAQITPYLFIIPFAYLPLRNLKKYGLFSGEVILAGFFARYALVWPLRHFFPRLRPFEVLENVNLLLPYKESLSFPSGHIAFLFALSTVVYFHYRKPGTALFALSFIAGVSRVITGMHWPLDVFAGALVGIFGGIVISEIFKIIGKKNSRR